MIRWNESYTLKSAVQKPRSQAGFIGVEIHSSPTFCAYKKCLEPAFMNARIIPGLEFYTIAAEIQ
jgi:hypothetical protein